MPFSSFTAGAQGSIIQDAIGSKLILRSTLPADNTQTATINGAVSGGPDVEVVSLNGDIEVVTTKEFDSITKIALSAVTAGTINVWGEGSAARGDIRADSLPADGNQFELGVAGDTVVYTFRTAITDSTPNEILIPGTLPELADNLASAINDLSTGPSNPTEGVDWSSATVANPYFEAVKDDDAVIGISDRAAINRSRDYVVTETLSHFSVRKPIGGATGPLLVQIVPGELGLSVALALSTSDLTETTIPGNFDFVSDKIGVDGNEWTIELRSSENATTFANAEVELSNEFADSAEILQVQPITLNGTPLKMLINGPQERLLFVRFKITNSAATDVPLHAFLVW